MRSLAPIAFVLLWSTGFIVAKVTVPHASAELILAVRLLLAAVLLGAAALLAKQTLSRKHVVLHCIAGGLLNGVYLGSSWWAIEIGMPAGIMALLGALQPIMVALGSFILLGERMRPQGWFGLAIGFLGVVLVLYPLVNRSGNQSLSAVALVAAVAGIIAMAAGTMIQRGSVAKDPMLVSTAVQNLAGAMVCGTASLLAGHLHWTNVVALWLGLGWSVLGLSVVGTTLLVWMTREQGATRVSALLLLVPPLAAIEAWLLFGERLVLMQLVGFAAAIGGVILTRTRGTADRSNLPR